MDVEQEVLQWFAENRDGLHPHVLQGEWHDLDKTVRMAFVLPSAVRPFGCEPTDEGMQPIFDIFYDRALMKFTHVQYVKDGKPQRVDLPD